MTTKKPLTIHADVNYHRGPLGWVVVAELSTPAADTRETKRRLSAAMYRIAATLETDLADGCAPDGDGLGYEVSVRAPQLELAATVRLVITDGDHAVDVAYAEEMMIDACVQCGLEPQHAGTGPLDRAEQEEQDLDQLRAEINANTQ